MVAVAVVNIGIAAALPVWSQAVKREKEAELIFRGLQYAEAIRIFQKRNGRFPTRLEELIEIEPRSIRRLWLDPLNDEPEWGLILAQGTPTTPQNGAAGVQNLGRELGGNLNRNRRERPNRRGRSGNRDQANAGESDRRRGRDRLGGRNRASEVSPRQRIEDPGGGRRGIPRAGEQVTRGPIIGVHSLSEDSSIRTFFGSEQHSDWQFTAELIPQLEGAAGVDSVPRLHTAWVGKALPAGTEQLDEGELDNPLDRDRRRDRRDNRRRRRGSGT